MELKMNNIIRISLIIFSVSLLISFTVLSNLYIKKNHDYNKIQKEVIQLKDDVATYKSDIRKKDATISEDETRFILIDVAKTHIIEKAEEINELTNFIRDTKDAYRAGENLLATISQFPNLLAFYTTQRRTEFVDSFLNYQKKYDQQKVEHLYSMMNLSKEKALEHSKQVDLYLNVAEKLRDRTNGQEIFKYMNTLDFAMLRAVDGPMETCIETGLGQILVTLNAQKALTENEIGELP